jgi:glutathione-regulated potassium-efflux system ancillary protein KefG
MSPRVNTEDLVDVHEVAQILGLSHRNSVSTYQRRYEDFPHPVVERSGGRTRLWVRHDIEAWAGRRSGRAR